MAALAKRAGTGKADQIHPIIRETRPADVE
jgi:hypothetical protein